APSRARRSPGRCRSDDPPRRAPTTPSRRTRPPTSASAPPSASLESYQSDRYSNRLRERCQARHGTKLNRCRTTWNAMTDGTGDGTLDLQSHQHERCDFHNERVALRSNFRTPSSRTTPSQLAVTSSLRSALAHSSRELRKAWAASAERRSALPYAGS